MQYKYLDENFFKTNNINSSKKNEKIDFDLVMQYLVNDPIYKNLFPLNEESWFNLSCNVNIYAIFKDNHEIEFDIVVPIINNSQLILNIIECKNFSRGIGKNWIYDLKVEGTRKFEKQIKILNEFINMTNDKIVIYSFFCYIDLNNNVHTTIYEFNNNQFELISNHKINEIIKINNNIVTSDIDIEKFFYIKHKLVRPIDKIIKLIKNQDFNSDIFCEYINDILSYILYEQHNKKNIFKIFGNSGTGKTYLGLLLYIYFSAKKDINVKYIIINNIFGKLIKNEIFNICRSNNIPRKIWENFFYETYSIKNNLQNNINIESNNIIIIDEFQRIGILDNKDGQSDNSFLSINQLNEMFDNNHCIILLDENQKLNPNADNFDFSSYILNTKRSFKEWELKNNFRIGNEHEEFLSNICIKNNPFQQDSYLNKMNNLDEKYINDKKKKLFVQTYDFKVTNDTNELLSLMKKDANDIKIISTIQGGEWDKDLKFVSDDIDMIFAQDKLMEYREYSFYNDNKKKYILYPYDTMSNEVESLFLLLPDTFIWDEKGINYKCWNFNCEKSKNGTNFGKGQLWSSIIRAKLNLVIYTKNPTTFKYCKKVQKIFYKFKEKVS